MKPYGHDKHDTLACKYGPSCCGSEARKGANARDTQDKTRRKRARRTAREFITSALRNLFKDTP